MRLKLPKTRGMLRREAASWLARLQSGREPEVEHKLRKWCEADPAHAAAFDRVKRSYEQAGLLRQSASANRASEARIARPARAPRYALAAAAALAAVVPVAILVSGRAPFVSDTHAVMLVTGVGEIRRVALEDGSEVTLDTSTSLKVEIGRSLRRAQLQKGRARFRIAPGSTPFIVEAGGTTITSAVSAFDVELAGPGSRVELLAGTADVLGPGEPRPSLAVHAGETVAALPSGIRTPRDIQPSGDWTRGMLEFDGTPLEAAVELANRYSDRQIVLAPDLAALRVTGAFRAGDTQGLARALARAFDLSLRETPRMLILAARKTSADRSNKNGG